MLSSIINGPNGHKRLTSLAFQSLSQQDQSYHQSQSQSKSESPSPLQYEAEMNKVLSFANLVKVHLSVVKFKNKLHDGKALSVDELTSAHVNFDTLKFSDYEEAVHYKVLGRDMHRLRVFATLDLAIQFCERLVIGSKLISFDDLFQATRCEDLATREVITGYLRLLSQDGNKPPIHSTVKRQTQIPTLPAIQQPHKTTQIFAQKGGSQSRLSLIPRQKQTLVPQDSDHQNYSLRARARPILRQTEESLASPHSPTKTDLTVSSRIKIGLQRLDSGYSYRQEEGAVSKSSGLKIISHDSRSVSD
jgi:hypothetical protein